MTTIREAAAQPVAVNPHRHFDPALLHLWDVVVPQRGEWPTMTVAPACDSRIRRTVSTDFLTSGAFQQDDDVTLPESDNLCPGCVDTFTAGVLS